MSDTAGAISRGAEKLPVVSTFWHGGPLPLWSCQCLRSFVAAGHETRVYTFNDALDLPPDVIRCDASEIIPESAVFYYKSGQWVGSVSGFSDLFRYKMLHDRGGYWVDADVFCRRPFPRYPRATVSREDARKINNAVIFAPAGDRMMMEAYRTAQRMGDNVIWGQTGPVLTTKLATSGQYDVDILEPTSFYPVHWKNAVRKFLLPSCADQVEVACKDSFGVHLYNEIFRRFRISTDMLPPRDSFLDRLMGFGSDSSLNRMSAAEVRWKNAAYYVRRVPPKLAQLATAARP